MKTKSKKGILVLGITGSFGSGKTTCAGMFKKLGASCVNADRIYHALIKPRASVYKKIVSVFGREILGRNKQIDRKRLAKLVFSKSQGLKELCQISHPAIIRRLRGELRKLKRIKSGAIVVIDAPLLIEAGKIRMVDKLIVVKASKKVQIARCRKQRGMSHSEVIKRIKVQAPLAKKLKLADYVIDNSGTLKQTRKQVRDIWESLKYTNSSRIKNLRIKHE